MKTIELIIDEQNGIPDATIPANRGVAIEIGYHETELREQIKQVGGFWNPDQKS